MKSIFITVIGVVLCQLSFAQTSGNLEVVGSAGEALESKDGSVSFTIGEIAVQQMEDSTSGATISEGFQQTYFWLTPIEEESTANFEVKIWPNPTLRFVNVDLGENNENEFVKGELYNLLGVKLDEFNLVENNRIDFSLYSVSSFILRIYDSNTSEVRVFKITKM